MGNKNTICSTCVVLLLLVSALTTLFGGEPLVVSTTGQAYRWDISAGPVPFNPDGGGLGTLDNAAAVAFVEGAFQRWADIQTAGITFANTGQIADSTGNPTDIDETNFGPIFSPEAANGQSEIVFDEDGAIFDLLFGEDSGVLGFAGPDFFTTSAPFTITEGSSFLDGGWIDGDSTNNEISIELFETVFVHEFGHYINLAHTQVNGLAFSAGENIQGFGPPPETSVETMYPFLTSTSEVTPHADDIAMVNFLYPAVPTSPSANSAGALGGTGAITGRIFFSDSVTAATGVNVIARNTSGGASTIFDDAVSQISGAFFEADINAPAGGTVDPDLDGRYTLYNLTPGAEYSVEIDEIGPGGFSSSTLIPLPGPEEFYNGAGESADSTSDDPADIEFVVPLADQVTGDIDIILNEAPQLARIARSDQTTEFIASVQSLVNAFDQPNGPNDYAAVQFSIPASLETPFTVAAANFFNNDGSTVWPRVLLTTDDGSGQPDMSSPLAEVTNFSGPATLAEVNVPFGIERSSDEDLFVVIQFPPGEAITDPGAGPAIGGDSDLTMGYVAGNLHSTDGVNFAENNTTVGAGSATFLNWTVTLDIEVGNTKVDDNEPNDDSGSATAIAYGETVKGTIDPSGELDFFVFTGSAGDTVRADVNAKPYGSDLDGFVHLLAANGDTVAVHDDEDLGVAQDPKLQAVLPADGDYILIMDSFENSAGFTPVGGPSFFYTLALDTFTPPFEPNDTPADATPLTVGEDLSAALDVTGDIDFFSFEGVEEDLFSTVLTVAGFTNFRPVLTVFDTDGSTILETRNSTSIESQLPADGTYFLAIADLNDSGGADFFYTLETDLSKPNLPVPLNLQATGFSDKVDLVWSEPDLGGTPATAADAADIEEIEPNNTTATAQELQGASPVVVNGNAEVADAGAIQINFTDGSSDDLEDLFVLNTQSAGLDILLSDYSADLDIYLLDNPPTAILAASNSSAAVESISLPSQAPGSYLIGVTIFDPGQGASDTSPYKLTVEAELPGGGPAVLSYNVYRSSQAGAVDNGSLAGSVDGLTTTFVDSALNPSTFFYQVTAVYPEGESDPSNEVSAVVTSVGRQTSSLPTVYALGQNYPNPFNPSTVIRYAIPPKHGNQKVSVTIFNMMGQRVRTLVNETQAANFYTLEWNGKNQSGKQVTSGLYLYQIKAGSFVETKKMLLIK